MVPLYIETKCLSEATKILYETTVKLSSKFIVQEKHLSKNPTSFDNSFEQIRIYSSFEATQFEPETIFENNIGDIKADYVKSITFLDTNLSAITSNKTSLSSEHLNADLMPGVILKSVPNFFLLWICSSCNIREIC